MVILWKFYRMLMTLLLFSPSTWGLNTMLKMCNNSILFYKKTTCIKFGDIIENGEKAILDGSELVWKASARYIGNFVDITRNDDFDSNAKT